VASDSLFLWVELGGEGGNIYINNYRYKDVVNRL